MRHWMAIGTLVEDGEVVPAVRLALRPWRVLTAAELRHACHCVNFVGGKSDEELIGATARGGLAHVLELTDQRRQQIERLEAELTRVRLQRTELRNKIKELTHAEDVVFYPSAIEHDGPRHPDFEDWAVRAKKLLEDTDE